MENTPDVKEFHRKLRKLNPEYFKNLEERRERFYENLSKESDDDNFKLSNSDYDAPSFVDPTTYKDAFGTQY